MSLKNRITAIALTLGSLGLFGCSQAPTPAPTTNTATESHAHDGWWCNEHGVPEEVCALCDSKLVAGFKTKNDWCQEHDRPDSQCFYCHPEKEVEFAAQYEAKYGKKPPVPEDNGKHESGSDKS